MSRASKNVSSIKEKGRILLFLPARQKTEIRPSSLLILLGESQLFPPLSKGLAKLLTKIVEVTIIFTQHKLVPPAAFCKQAECRQTAQQRSSSRQDYHRYGLDMEKDRCPMSELRRRHGWS